MKIFERKNKKLMIIGFVAIFFVALAFILGRHPGGTVFLTVFSGVLVYVLGQIILKLAIEPVHNMKKTIGQISHSLIENAAVISNPGLLEDDVNQETSQHLRALSAQLRSHLYLVPKYNYLGRIFHLPTEKDVLSASKNLIGLSNGVLASPTISPGIYKVNALMVESICCSLNIYFPEEERYPK